MHEHRKIRLQNEQGKADLLIQCTRTVHLQIHINYYMRHSVRYYAQYWHTMLIYFQHTSKFLHYIRNV